MRTDVKLGVVIALATVLVAGGYYMDGDSDEQPVEMAKKSLADVAKPAAGQKSGVRNTGAPAKSTGAAKQNVARRQPGKASPGKNTRRAIAKNKTAAKPSASRRSKTASARTGQQNKNKTRQAAASKTPKPKPVRASPASPPVKSIRPGKTSTARAQRGGGGAPTARNPGSTVPGDAGKLSSRPGTTNARQGNAAKPATKTGGTPAGPKSADASKRRNPLHRGARGTARPNLRNSTKGNAIAKRGAATTTRRKPATSPTKVNHRNVAVDMHRVQPGDSLAALAKMYYGHERHVSFLLKSNPKITDPRRLALGTVVRIPPLPVGDPATKPTSAPVRRVSTRDGQRSNGSAKTYTVKAGDTFYGIAGSQLGDAGRWRSLYELNAKLVGDDPSRLRIGQVLKLPSK